MATAIYDTFVDDVFSVIAVELDLAETAPVRTHGHCVLYSLSLAYSPSDEVSKTNAVKLLDDFQFDLIDAVLNCTDAKYVGRIRREIDRDLAFYFSDADLEQISKIDSPALNQECYLPVEVGLENLSDEEWQVYRDLLLPGEEDEIDVCN